MEEQLEFAKGDQDSGIIEGYQAPFSEEKEFFCRKVSRIGLLKTL
jgi:hypothetical protein